MEGEEAHLQEMVHQVRMLLVLLVRSLQLTVVMEATAVRAPLEVVEQ